MLRRAVQRAGKIMRREQPNGMLVALRLLARSASSQRPLQTWALQTASGRSSHRPCSPRRSLFSSNRSPCMRQRSNASTWSTPMRESFAARSARPEAHHRSTRRTRSPACCRRSQLLTRSLFPWSHSTTNSRRPKPPFLVKLDTHGVEAAILGGAQKTLTRSVAWIIEAYNQRIVSDCLLFWELCHSWAHRAFGPSISWMCTTGRTMARCGRWICASSDRTGTALRT